MFLLSCLCKDLRSGVSFFDSAITWTTLRFKVRNNSVEKWQRVRVGALSGTITNVVGIWPEQNMRKPLTCCSGYELKWSGCTRRLNFLKVCEKSAGSFAVAASDCFFRKLFRFRFFLLANIKVLFCSKGHRAKGDTFPNILPQRIYLLKLFMFPLLLTAMYVRPFWRKCIFIDWCNIGVSRRMLVVSVVSMVVRPGQDGLPGPNLRVSYE